MDIGKKGVCLLVFFVFETNVILFKTKLPPPEYDVTFLLEKILVVGKCRPSECDITCWTHHDTALGRRIQTIKGVSA